MKPFVAYGADVSVCVTQVCICPYTQVCVCPYTQALIPTAYMYQSSISIH